MAIPIRTAGEMLAQAHAAQVLSSILIHSAQELRAGLRTIDIDRAVRDLITEAGAVPVLDGYVVTGRPKPYAGATCISINEEVVHAPPGPRIIREGDLVTIDISISVDGWMADAAVTLGIGELSDSRRGLLNLGREAVAAGLEAITPGALWSDVAASVQRVVQKCGGRLIASYAGHGIGRELHEPPRLPLTAPDVDAWRKSQGDLVLRPGMVLTIEPIVTFGSAQTSELDDGWTVVTADRADVVHEERMIGITRSGSQDFTSRLTCDAQAT
jgi:methionyl aminopeptidase